MFKKSYELSVKELEGRCKLYRGVFWIYVFAALGVSIINGFASISSINGLNENKGLLTGTEYLLLLNSILISVILFLVIFSWLVNESSYYKMLQLHSETLIYLKKKGEAGREYDEGNMS